MDVNREIEDILQLRTMRSSDRANIERMQKQLRGGGQLTEQERLNLWAYLIRYRPELASQGSTSR